MYSTGIVTNTRDTGTAATNVVLNVHNTNELSLTTIIRIVASVDSDTFYVAYLNGFVTPSGGYEVMTFNIAGNVAYEVQLLFDLTTNDGTLPALVSVYGIDEFGNPSVNQGFAPGDLYLSTQDFSL
ncbi:hypothetical protein [Paenibacillus albus]|uniref:Uncharacterized protein n=1 Tax=Paenibacillus albus TaxID=2495582 RepID=A0A3Q8X9T7_9BACL|nr:hypothetical protein [Paenibacillus albus]AZN42614.1 hypothetical protein EJC50_25175 [Paenibacillus albus]